MITQEELKEQLDYNSETGIFRWKVSKAKSIKVGDISGCLNNNGYHVIKIKGKSHPTHRLVWLLFNGEIPNGYEINHINGNRSDNRIENLRIVTRRQSSQNNIKHRNGKLVGSSYNKKLKKWQASIKINGQSKFLGYYKTAELAHQAYNNKLEELK